MTWIPVAWSDNWTCDQCGHTEETQSDRDWYKRAKVLAAPAIADGPRTQDAALAVLAEAGPYGLPFIGNAERRAVARLASDLQWIVLVGLVALVPLFILAVKLRVVDSVWPPCIAAIALVVLLWSVKGKRAIRWHRVRLLEAAERAASKPGSPYALWGFAWACHAPLTQDVAIKGLNDLAQSLTDEQIAGLEYYELVALSQTLAPPAVGRLNRKRHWAVTGTIARVLSRTAYGPALKTLRELTSPIWLGFETPKEVREQAKAAIEAISARLQVAKENALLLRAATGSDLDTATLLRPAGEPDLPPEQLLRPSSADGESG